MNREKTICNAPDTVVVLFVKQDVMLNSIKGLTLPNQNTTGIIPTVDGFLDFIQVVRGAGLAQVLLHVSVTKCPR